MSVAVPEQCSQKMPSSTWQGIRRPRQAAPRAVEPCGQEPLWKGAQFHKLACFLQVAEATRIAAVRNIYEESPALFIHFVKAVADGSDFRVSRKLIYHHTKLPAFPPVVAVQERHNFAAAFGDSGIERRSWPAVLFAQEPHSGFKLAHDFRRAVGGGEILFEHADKRFSQDHRLRFWWPRPCWLWPPPGSFGRKIPRIACACSGHHRTDADDSPRPAPRKLSCSGRPGAGRS